MEVKLKTIIDAIPSLSKISGGDLSLGCAYRLQKSVSALQREINFFSEQRRKIFDKYGTPKDDGTYSFDKENERPAIGELEELLSLEVEPDIEVIEIPITENIRVSANDVGLLSPFIQFTE